VHCHTVPSMVSTYNLYYILVYSEGHGCGLKYNNITCKWGRLKAVCGSGEFFFEFNIFLNSIFGPTIGFFSMYLTIGKVRVIK
jgi:hypothetical protein